MKITLVDYSGKGGIGHYTYFLYKALKEINTETILLTTKDFEFEKEEDIFDILPSHSKMKFKLFKGIIYTISLIKVFIFLSKRKGEIIHFHEIKIPLLEIPLFKILSRKKARIVLTSHNIFRAEARFFSPLLKKVYKQLDGIIFHSEANKEELFEQIEFKSAKMWKIIPHGDSRLMVNRDMNRKKARKILEIKEDRFVILFFGYIRKYKGLDILVNAISKIRLNFKNVFLLIAGKEIENFKKYKEMIKRLELEDFVQTYLYYIPNNEISTFFEAADVVVLPYRRIFQSGVIHLAFAHSKPAIASNLGGIPDLVINGKTGYLVEPGDPHLLASAIEKFLHLSEEQRVQMGINGKTLSEDFFSWKNSAKKTLEFYKDLI